jgi:hypothetical protein
MGGLPTAARRAIRDGGDHDAAVAIRHAFKGKESRKWEPVDTTYYVI